MIEVGVDVPAATVMVIEHAERFGLAQLHQLRGRVGRGSAKSTCLLLYAQPLGETAKARLAIMRETEDGFRIAEEDLKLRGAGELLGTRQSGLPDMRLADLAVHAELLQAARDDARLVDRARSRSAVRARRGAPGPALPVPAATTPCARCARADDDSMLLRRTTAPHPRPSREAPRHSVRPYPPGADPDKRWVQRSRKVRAILVMQRPLCRCTEVGSAHRSGRRVSAGMPGTSFNLSSFAISADGSDRRTR